ncbi:MAG: hypothetical protein H6Q39_16 [Chloroflexi bacterium]|nr:hypothetical protein [Chloroflexota bacterium]
MGIINPKDESTIESYRDMQEAGTGPALDVFSIMELKADGLLFPGLFYIDFDFFSLVF